MIKWEAIPKKKRTSKFIRENWKDIDFSNLDHLEWKTFVCYTNLPEEFLEKYKKNMAKS